MLARIALRLDADLNEVIIDLVFVQTEKCRSGIDFGFGFTHVQVSVEVDDDGLRFFVAVLNPIEEASPIAVGIIVPSTETDPAVAALQCLRDLSANRFVAKLKGRMKKQIAVVVEGLRIGLCHAVEKTANGFGTRRSSRTALVIFDSLIVGISGDHDAGFLIEGRDGFDVVSAAKIFGSFRV